MSATEGKFRLEGTDGRARAGTLSLRNGEVPTPCFMPVGTPIRIMAVAKSTGCLTLSHQYSVPKSSAVAGLPETVDMASKWAGFASIRPRERRSASRTGSICRLWKA